MSEISNYLEDLYAQPGYIAAEPRIHGPLRFTFRPTRSLERQAFFKKLEPLTDPTEIEKEYAEFAAKKIASWDLVKPDGSKVPVTVEVLTKRIHCQLADKLYAIVSGKKPSDVDPLWSENDKTDASGTDGDDSGN